MTLKVADITFEYLKRLDYFLELEEKDIIYWTQWLRIHRGKTKKLNPWNFASQNSYRFRALELFSCKYEVDPLWGQLHISVRMVPPREFESLLHG